jgi:hypothetical protein
MEKEIAGYNGDYTVDENGIIRSYKTGCPHVMSVAINKKSGYANIKLCKNNVITTYMVHRIVATAFLPNPENLPQVNHKNKNRNDNRVENLEWISVADNLKESYDTMPPTRNFRNCSLYYCGSGEKIGDFQSIKEACRYASEHFGCSYTSLQRYETSGGIKLTRSVETNSKAAIGTRLEVRNPSS